MTKKPKKRVRIALFLRRPWQGGALKARINAAHTIGLCVATKVHKSPYKAPEITLTPMEIAG